jgi:hypothetical protein
MHDASERKGRVERAHIAIYGGGGAPYHHAAVLARSGHAVDFVFPVDIVDGCLHAYDAFVMPGGGYRAMSGQIDPLGHEGASAIRAYVRDGGMYIGSCAGSYDAATVPASFVAVCPAQADLCLLGARIWNETDTSFVGLQSPGVGVIRVRNVRPDHPIMQGMPESFTMTHYNGPLFSGGTALAVVEGGTEHFTPAEAFLEPYDGPTLIGRAAEEGIANIVTGAHGRGMVVLFGSHPEFGFGLPMDDPQLPGRMLDNAVRWHLTEHRSPEERSTRLRIHEVQVEEADPAGSVHRMARRIREQCERLQLLEPSRPVWLDRRFAMSTFGLSSQEIWSRALQEIVRLSHLVEALSPTVPPWALAYRQPAAWDLDGGFHGVIALLEQTEQMLGAAAAAWDIDLGEPQDDPYAFALSSPFHLVAGSYLAAVGRAASAALLCQTYARQAT